MPEASVAYGRYQLIQGPGAIGQRGMSGGAVGEVQGSGRPRGRPADVHRPAAGSDSVIQTRPITEFAAFGHVTKPAGIAENRAAAAVQKVL
jgi:hypothetical protein